MGAIAMSIAGSDPSGGAGIQADLKSFSALGVYGAAVVTALTAQNTLGVQSIYELPAAFVGQQIVSVLSDLRVDAIKIGMLGDDELIEAVAAALDHFVIDNIVLDPVLTATSGDLLVSDDSLDTLRDVLIPRALLITPNLEEAACLLETVPAEDDATLLAQAEALYALGPRAVLLTGGDGKGRESADIFFDGSQALRLAAPRIDTPHTHGTGCSLSAAIAAKLAQGHDLLHAVAEAKAYVSEAIAHAYMLQVGTGRGPIHHFHALWKEEPLPENAE